MMIQLRPPHPSVLLAQVLFVHPWLVQRFFLHFLAGMLVYLCGGDMSLCYHATVDTRTLAATRSLYITLAWFVLHA